MNRRPAIAAALVLLLLPSAALAQVFVYPRRADRSNVNTFDFEWRHVDILVGPAAKGEADRPDKTAPLAPGVPGGPIPAAPTTPPDVSATSRPLAEPPQETEKETSNPPANGMQVVTGSPDGGVPPSDGGMMASSTQSVSELIAATALDGGTGADGGSGLALGASDAGPKYATSLGAATGGVRFYFYERERQVAERAAPVIEEAYRYLVERFQYVPTETFPYILYNSYQEFLQTNVFAVSEGTLGVTSTEDLKLSLPYLGDHRLFDEISTHELAHQFTIQKIRTVADTNKTFGDPLQAIPLWFIEGLAEFYAKRGLDPEAEMLVRDLMVNPDLMKGYAFLDFFSPGPYGYLWIYKVGQVRVAFLEEEYGAGFIQRVLNESPRLVGGGAKDAPSLKFEELLQRLTGDDPKRISSRFENWMKRRAFKEYLASEQAAPALELMEERAGITTAMNSSPDGRVIMYRTIIPETGESRLYIVDPQTPGSQIKVVGDGVPGAESLHPIFGRNFALAGDRLAYVAEVTARDVIYVQRYTYTSEQRTNDELVRRDAIRTGFQRQTSFNVDLDLGDRTAYRVGKHGLLGVPAVAFSPDGKRLAFIGINDAGIRDVYVLNLEEGGDAVPRKLTDDIFAERQLTWGPSGIIYTSDATSHRLYNLFRVRPDAPSVPERLTSEARDHADPVALADGRIFFVTWNKSSSDLHELLPNGSIVRRTDLTTGVFEPGPGPEGSLWVLFHQSGERRPSLLRAPKMLSLPTEPSPPAEPPPPLAFRPLTNAEPYHSFARQNLELGPIFGFAGAGSGGFFGQVFAMASDRLKNHALLLNMAIYGSFSLTDGVLLYVNQENRTTWGAGLFQSLRFRLDESFANQGVSFFSGERYFGALGSIRYPLSTFLYLQGDLTVGGSSYFIDSYTAFRLNNPTFNPAGQDLYAPWIAANDDMRFQTELTGQIGYNTIRYHYATGPLAGSSALLEASVGVQPFNDEAYSNLRLDLERYFPIYGRSNIFIRAAGGTTFGGRYARSYFLSSFDTLRGVNFGDEDWLLGRHFAYSTLELQVPLNDIIRVAFLSDLEAIAGVDVGGVGNSGRVMWDRRTLDFVLGLNLSLGPLLMRLHFARPVDIGAEFGKPDPGWVTNFSIGIAGLNGFFDRRGEGDVRPPSMVPNGYLGGGARPGL